MTDKKEELKRPEKRAVKIKCLQGQMKEGEKKINCSSYPRGMKHEVLAHYQGGYTKGMSIGVDMAFKELEAYHEQQMRKSISVERIEEISYLYMAGLCIELVMLSGAEWSEHKQDKLVIVNKILAKAINQAIEEGKNPQ